jgi:hypothetical protein
VNALCIQHDKRKQKYKATKCYHSCLKLMTVLGEPLEHDISENKPS